MGLEPVTLCSLFAVRGEGCSSRVVSGTTTGERIKVFSIGRDGCGS